MQLGGCDVCPCAVQAGTHVVSQPERHSTEAAAVQVLSQESVKRDAQTFSAVAGSHLTSHVSYRRTSQEAAASASR